MPTEFLIGLGVVAALLLGIAMLVIATEKPASYWEAEHQKLKDTLPPNV